MLCAALYAIAVEGVIHLLEAGKHGGVDVWRSRWVLSRWVLSRRVLSRRILDIAIKDAAEGSR